MVITKLAQIAISVGAKWLPKIQRAEYNVYRGAGWKPHAARPISHGTALGNIIGTLINSDRVGSDNGAYEGNGPKTNPQDKTRVRFRGNGRSSSRSSFRRYRHKRCSCARKYRRGRNRF